MGGTFAEIKRTVLASEMLCYVSRARRGEPTHKQRGGQRLRRVRVMSRGIRLVQREHRVLPSLGHAQGSEMV